MNIIEKRKIFLTISAILIVISIVMLFVRGLNLSIDFTGGSRLELAKDFDGEVLSRDEIENIYNEQKLKINSIQETDGGYRISSSSISEQEKDKIIERLKAQELSFEFLGPTIGNETKNKAIVAVLIAILAITTYIAIAFRKSGGVISSWKFGVAAIIALAHDVIITLGAFSLFGLLFEVEIDALFVTAILTIMGFSVHDTIVVFDRIRENITNNVKRLSFGEVVNNSIKETIGRSLNTSVTVIFVLFAMALFGGESIRWFIIAFIIGVVVGTYSSIFIAAPILLEWHNLDKNGGFKSLKSRLNLGGGGKNDT